MATDGRLNLETDGLVIGVAEIRTPVGVKLKRRALPGETVYDWLSAV